MSNPSTQPRIARISLPVPLYREFDYLIPDSLLAETPAPVVGGRVAVRFAHRPLIGICTELDPEDAYEDPSPLETAIDAEPLLDARQLKLARWLADYYHHPLGEVLATVLPAEARRGAPAEITRETAWRICAEHSAAVTGALASEDASQLGLGRARRQFALLATLHEHGALSRAAIAELGYSSAVLKSLAATRWVEQISWMPKPREPEPETPLALTPEQAEAVATITAAPKRYNVFLLDGITGSGKTEVYLRALETVLEDGGQALMLVPEIGLTPQTVRRVQRRFPGVVALHSAMNDRERWQAWLRCAQGDARILIGTRSACFAAFADLRMIIVDEEHDSSFKQQDGLRYSARDFAVMRGREEHIPVVLGSATPSLESLHNVELGRYTLTRLRQRPGAAELPELNLLDIRGHDLHDGVSTPLIHLIRRHLTSGGQVLTFINRRGFAPTLMCTSCGWVATCQDCDARMTLHSRPEHLRCHHCGARAAPVHTCPECQSKELLPVGQGTQRAEQGLAELFPGTEVLRIDRDVTRSQQQLGAQLDTILEGGPMILVGTQMLAKGHHFPGVTLVAVLGADGGFFSADFRAPERMAQTIMQVAGRAGRAERRGEVWIQTYQPEHPLLKRLVSEGYEDFARHELNARKAADMPPARPMALLRADAVRAEDGLRFLRDLKPQLLGVEAYGPAPAPVQRISNRFRHQLMVLADDRRALRRAMLAVRDTPVPRGLRWSIDVDPYDSF